MQKVNTAKTTHFDPVEMFPTRIKKHVFTAKGIGGVGSAKGATDLQNKVVYIPTENNAYARTVRLHEALHAIYTKHSKDRLKRAKAAGKGLSTMEQALEDARLHLNHAKTQGSVRRDELTTALRDIRGAIRRKDIDKKLKALIALRSASILNSHPCLSDEVNNAALIQNKLAELCKQVSPKYFDSVCQSLESIRQEKMIDAASILGEYFGEKSKEPKESKPEVKQPQQPQPKQQKEKNTQESESSESSSENTNDSDPNSEDSENESNESKGMGKSEKSEDEESEDTEDESEETDSEDKDSDESDEESEDSESIENNIDSDTEESEDTEESDSDSTGDSDSDSDYEESESDSEVLGNSEDSISESTESFIFKPDFGKTKEDEKKEFADVSFAKVELGLSEEASELLSEKDQRRLKESVIPPMRIHQMFATYNIPTMFGDDIKHVISGTKIHAKKLATIVGPVPPKIFTKTYRRNGGSILFDASASMGITSTRLLGLLEKAPAATLAFYNSDTDYDFGTGNLWIFAHQGKRAPDFSGIYGCDTTLTSRKTAPFGEWGCGNLVDFHAMQWLLALPEPRFFFTDAQFTGPLARIAENLLINSIAAKKIRQVTSFAEMEKILANPQKYNNDPFAPVDGI